MGKKTKKGKSRAGRSRSRSFKKNNKLEGTPTGTDQGPNIAETSTPMSPASVVPGPEEINVINDKPMPPTPLTQNVSSTEKGDELGSYQATKETVADNEPVKTVAPADGLTKLEPSKEVMVSTPEAFVPTTESVPEPAVAEVVKEAMAPVHTAETALESTVTMELVNEGADFEGNESSPTNESTAADTTVAVTVTEKDPSDAKHTEEEPLATEQTSGVTELVVEEETLMVASDAANESSTNEPVMEKSSTIVPDETVVVASKPEQTENPEGQSEPETQVETDNNSSVAVTDVPPEIVPEVKNEPPIPVPPLSAQPEIEDRADDTQPPLEAVGIVPESGEAVKEEPVASDKEPALVQDKLPAFVVFHKDLPMMDEPMTSEANESQEKCDCSACIIL